MVQVKYFIHQIQLTLFVRSFRKRLETLVDAIFKIFSNGSLSSACRFTSVFEIAVASKCLLDKTLLSFICFSLTHGAEPFLRSRQLCSY
jgi:hypothetical protein